MKTIVGSGKVCLPLIHFALAGANSSLQVTTIVKRQQSTSFKTSQQRIHNSLATKSSLTGQKRQLNIDGTSILSDANDLRHLYATPPSDNKIAKENYNRFT